MADRENTKGKCGKVSESMMNHVIPEPEFEKLFRLETKLKDTYPLGDIGPGYSEIVTISGGKAEGIVNGEIMDFGADWGLLYSGNVNVLDTKCLLQTDDGAFISISYRGRMIMTLEEMDECAVNGVPDPSEYYFRTSVEFSTGAEKYKWLNDIVAFAMVIMTPEGNVCMDIYKLK